MSRSKKCSAVTILCLASLIALSCAKTFKKCQLARMFLHKYKFPREHIDDWVCLARWESHYNSSAVGTLNWDGSKDFGLFQISELYWCKNEGKGKACDANCEDFLDDDLDDDVRCVKRIYDEHEGLSGNGFNAWVAWKTRCQGDLSEYLRGCNLRKKNQEKDKGDRVRRPGKDFSPGIVAPAADASAKNSQQLRRGARPQRLNNFG